MDLISEIIRQLIGVPPPNYEWVEYIFKGCIAIMFLKSFIMFFSIPFKTIKL